MVQFYSQEIEWGGRKLSLETGKMARQADGAVLVRYGGTVVLATVVASREIRADIDFLALSVHYQEKTFAVGKIPGSFFKREGKPSEKEVLVSRLIDRPLRPLFPPNFLNEVQVICTVLSHDLENDPDVPAIIGASAALTLSGLPFFGPLGAARVGYIAGEYVLNPAISQIASSDLDLVVAGTHDGVLMVESEAKELSEDIMLKAVDFGHKALQPVLDMIVRLAQEAARDPWPLPQDPDGQVLKDSMQALVVEPLRDIYHIPDKAQRKVELEALKARTQSQLGERGTLSLVHAASTFKELARHVARCQILEEGRRLDQRGFQTVRPIVCEAGLLPVTHGSALFTRGNTQVLAVTTLGTGEDSQLMDTLEGEYRETFLLHYNFPQFCVGSLGRVGAPGRREIGHGKLAWRAIRPVLPEAEGFPYTIRVVSEVLESDGSSSMATVCGTSLALMDAGVPLAKPVAGIAMGLVKQGDRFQVLSDISGEEDSLGDMDFKVAGTAEGITALQMDLKITSIDNEIMAAALQQALQGRLHILKEMARALDGPRQSLNAKAPRMVTFQVAKEKIREIIGPGGKIIREICETTTAKIDIQDDGTVKVSSANLDGLSEAVARIKTIAYEPQIGDVFRGKVVKIAPFGAFVNFIANQDGLVHISELSAKRVEQVEDIVQVGDEVCVKIIGTDARGKIKLSMKQVDSKVIPPKNGSRNI